MIDVYRGIEFHPPADGDLNGVRVPLKGAPQCVTCCSERGSDGRLVHSDGCALATALFRLPIGVTGIKPELEVTGPPMRGFCSGCGTDLEELVRAGKTGHVCFGRSSYESASRRAAPATAPSPVPWIEDIREMRTMMLLMAADIAATSTNLRVLTERVAPELVPCGACTLLARAGAGPCDKHAPTRPQTLEEYKADLPHRDVIVGPPYGDHTISRGAPRAAFIPSGEYACPGCPSRGPEPWCPDCGRWRQALGKLAPRAADASALRAALREACDEWARHHESQFGREPERPPYPEIKARIDELRRLAEDGTPLRPRPTAVPGPGKPEPR